MDDMNKKIESEINFLDALKSPLRLFGLVYFYFFAVALIIGVYFVKNLDEISFNQIPGTALDTLRIERDIPLKVGGIRPAMDLELISNPTSDFIAKGKDLYQTNCASCHGAEGRGDGPAGAVLNPPPRSFYELDGWKNGREFSQLYKTLQEGIAGSGMTAYEFIAPEDRVAIIQFIRTLTDYPEVTEDEIVSLDSQYQLTKGVVEPNNIPIKSAKKIIASEFRKSTELLMERSVSENTNLILQNYSIDPIKTIQNFKLRFNDSLDFNDFIFTASSDPKMLALKSEIVNLTDNEWEQLYQYLSSL
ncbi:MAG: cytochrome c [Melioribacteraceae bacterium]|nr:cytochrome c [Melioribacteraceae bacterium]